jgi:hypothetical protein
MRIRFTENSRHGDWKKGEVANVVQTLAMPPKNQYAIYVISLENGSQVWATDRDVEPFEQMTIFDVLDEEVS